MKKERKLEYGFGNFGESEDEDYFVGMTPESE